MNDLVDEARVEFGRLAKDVTSRAWCSFLDDINRGEMTMPQAAQRVGELELGLFAAADAYALAVVDSLPLPRYHHDAHQQRSREQKQQAQCLVCRVEALRERLEREANCGG